MGQPEGAAAQERIIQPGMVVAGRYRLTGPIGEGASATVWEAMHETLDREVAVKFVELYGRDSKGMAERFLREAKVAAAVRHRNVIDILDFGQTEEGIPYMVMERLEGESLADRLCRHPPPSVAESLSIMLRVLSGLGAVHDAGIVHRDIKPENVYLVRDADGIYPKLLDFGISRATGDSGLESVLPTREDLVVGTPQYMSPEQARGLTTLDARSDLWAVGVMLFELLTGRLPWDAEAAGDVLIKVVTEPTPALEVIRPDLSDDLCQIIEKALLKEPVARYQTAREMREDLLAVVGEGAKGSMAPPPGQTGEHLAFSEIGAAEAFELAAEEAYEQGDSGIISLKKQQEQQARLRRASLASQDRSSAPTEDEDEQGKSLPPVDIEVATEPAVEVAAEVEAEPKASPRPQLDTLHLNRKPKGRGLIFGLVALVAIGAVAAALMIPSSNSTQAPPAPESTALPPGTQAPTKVTVEIRDLPDDSTLTIDGTQHLGDEIHLERSDATHEVEVTTSDGRTWNATVQADQDRELTVDMPEAEMTSNAQSAARRRAIRRRRAARRRAAMRSSMMSEESMGNLLRNPGF